MDPNANLREQRELAREILELVDRIEYGRDARRIELSARAARLAELVEALDQWIAGGGFLPDSWEIAHKRAAPPPQCAERTGGGHQWTADRGFAPRTFRPLSASEPSRAHCARRTSSR